MAGMRQRKSRASWSFFGNLYSRVLCTCVYVIVAVFGGRGCQGCRTVFTQKINFDVFYRCPTFFILLSVNFLFCIQHSTFSWLGLFSFWQPIKFNMEARSFDKSFEGIAVCTMHMTYVQWIFRWKQHFQLHKTRIIVCCYLFVWPFQH